MTKQYDGATLDEALEKAAAALDVEVDDLEYEVVSEGKKDFWGLDEQFVRIRAWLVGQEEEPAPPEPAPEEAGEREPAPPRAETTKETAPVEGGFWSGGAAPSGRAGEPQEPVQVAGTPEPEAEAGAEEPKGAGAPEAPAVAPDRTAGVGERAAGELAETLTELADTATERADAAAERADAATERADAAADEDLAVQTDVEEIEEPLQEIEGFLAKIFEDMGFDCSAEAHEEEDCYLALVSGEDKEHLLEGQGRALSALELILNHAFRHRLSDGRKIRVDAGDFRSRREEELRDLAYQVAHSAKESSTTQETQPLNPYERRLVHLALADDPAVTTRSRGSGFLKNVQVIPKKGGRNRR